ncbi:MAG: hypothetical protein NC089_04005, partial [Bacteroides sp.]|nr:hypothetical protein [Bacteroides sp.]MCM1548558.1 hypothetical protein [Clostridium sp.]
IKIESVISVCKQPDCQISTLTFAHIPAVPLGNCRFLVVGLSPYQNRICHFRLQAAGLPDFDFGTARCNAYYIIVDGQRQ